MSSGPSSSTSSSFSSSSSSTSTSSFVKPRPPPAPLTSTAAPVEVVEEPIVAYHVIPTPSGFLQLPTPPPTPSTASTSSTSTMSTLASVMRTSLPGSDKGGTATATVSFSKDTSSGVSSEEGEDEYEHSLISPVFARPGIHALGGARIRDRPSRASSSSHSTSYSTSTSRSALHSPTRAQTRASLAAPPPPPPPPLPRSSSSTSSSTSTVILKRPAVAFASPSYTSATPKTPAARSTISSYSASASDARRSGEGSRPGQAASAYSYLVSSVAAKSSEAPSEEMSLTVDGLDVTTLSDDDLFEKLKGLGVAVGPIVASTRLVYQKKLALLLRGSDAVDAPTTNGDLDASDAYSDSDAEVEEEARAETASHVSSHLSHVSSRATTSSRPPSTTSTPSASRTGAADLRRRVLTSGGKSEPVETSPPSILDSEVVYDPERHTPSPRRSLRTVTSTVTSNETITYRKFLNNGKSYVSSPVETAVEEVEKPTSAPSKLWMLLRLLVKLLFILLIIAVIYILYEHMSTDSPFAALEHAARKALESAVGEEPEGEGASPPPVGEDSGAEPAKVLAD